MAVYYRLPAGASIAEGLADAGNAGQSSDSLSFRIFLVLQVWAMPQRQAAFSAPFTPAVPNFKKFDKTC